MYIRIYVHNNSRVFLQNSLHFSLLLMSSTTMEEKLTQSESHCQSLQSQLSDLQDEQDSLQTQLKTLSDSSDEKIASLESEISTSHDQIDTLRGELSCAQQERCAAVEDAKKYSEQATSTQELYERELLQHGRSMETLHSLKTEVR